MGRPAKPQALKDLAGNPGRRKPRVQGQTVAEVAASASAAGEFAPPKDLTAPERKVWLDELHRWQAAGLAKPSDLTAFRSWVEARALFLRCKRVVDKDGPTYVTKSKHGSMIRERPEVKIMNGLARLMTKLSDQLASNTKQRIATTSQLATAKQYDLFPPGASPEGAPQDKKNADDPVSWLQ